MKRLIVLSLAALVAATAVGTTMTGASAAPIVSYPSNNKAPPFLSGAVLWWLLQPSYKPLHPNASGNPHVQWCRTHYRTYNPATDKFYVKRGVLAGCVSR
jgi:hypothetical protein